MCLHLQWLACRWTLVAVNNELQWLSCRWTPVACLSMDSSVDRSIPVAVVSTGSSGCRVHRLQWPQWLSFRLIQVDPVVVVLIDSSSGCCSSGSSGCRSIDSSGCRSTPVAPVAVVRSTPVAVIPVAPVAVVSMDRLQWLSCRSIDSTPVDRLQSIDSSGCRSTPVFQWLQWLLYG